MPKSKIKQLQQIIDESENIVFFGGAGVSTESGIPDFRSTDGLYNQVYKFQPEEILSHRFFLEQPDDFYEFYQDKIMLQNSDFVPEPNACHKKLAELEECGKLKAVVTQNIDGLHQKAGSKNVFELHGSIERNYCVGCGRLYDGQFVRESMGTPYCDCGGIIKPDVVLYGEQLDDDVVRGAIRAITAADTLIVGGTSLNVYPAAGFLQYFRGKHLVLINKGETAIDIGADLVIKEKIGEVFCAISL